MICVSISEKNFNQCLTLIDKFDFCEIRLDLCLFNDEQIKHLFSSKHRLLATCRPDKIGAENAKKMLMTAIAAGANYVDIEIEAPLAYKQEMMAFARKYHCQIIISYHNYQLTPSAVLLENIIEEGFSYGADIVKIATLSHHPTDNAALMSVYGKNRKLVVFGMGKSGIITRVAAPLMGALFTFAAPDEASATAPGQMTEKQLRDIYKLIG